MSTFDDYDGVYFTIQSIRMYHPEILDVSEFLVIDNNPTGKHSEAIKHLSKSIKNMRVVPFGEYQSAFVKGKVFEFSTTPYVMCVDSHVILSAGSISRLIEYFDSGKDDGNLLHGPLIYDDMKHVSTHLDLCWRGQMWGTWATDLRGVDPNNPPFEIPAQGMGAFSCRRDSWLGFNPNFRGFGGEEGYIHEKFRKNGKKVICLPFFRWLHRFGRPAGIPYNLKMDDRIINYIIGRIELGMEFSDVKQHFINYISEGHFEKMVDLAKARISK